MRRRLQTAVVQLGLVPSLTADGWTRVTNNWNQVCNAGMVLGALTVAAEEPDLAVRIIARALESVPRSMHEYSPDGAYPEGSVNRRVEDRLAQPRRAAADHEVHGNHGGHPADHRVAADPLPEGFLARAAAFLRPLYRLVLPPALQPA